MVRRSRHVDRCLPRFGGFAPNDFSTLARRRSPSDSGRRRRAGELARRPRALLRFPSSVSQATRKVAPTALLIEEDELKLLLVSISRWPRLRRSLTARCADVFKVPITALVEAPSGLGAWMRRAERRLLESRLAGRRAARPIRNLAAAACSHRSRWRPLRVWSSPEYQPDHHARAEYVGRRRTPR